MDLEYLPGCVRREEYGKCSYSKCTQSRMLTRRGAPVLGAYDFLLSDIAAELRTVLLPGRYSLPERDSPPRESQQPVAKT
jgi:hypothetical protein